MAGGLYIVLQLQVRIRIHGGYMEGLKRSTPQYPELTMRSVRYSVPELGLDGLAPVAARERVLGFGPFGHCSRMPRVPKHGMRQGTKWKRLDCW